MDNSKLLIVEDDPNLGSILHEYLDLKGYQTTLCTDGEQGLIAFNREAWDLVILDVMMPKKDGFTLAKEIREQNKEVPFIFLTAKSMKEDTLEGLRLGADDYMTKPFSMEELLLRLGNILRRAKKQQQALPSQQPESYTIGSISFDPTRQILRTETNEVKLTGKESQLLHLLCQHKNQVMPRSLALKQIWNDDSYFNARSMDVYITKLRKHLKMDNTVEIQTVHGQGFRLLSH